MGRSEEPPATAEAGSSVNPELPQLLEAPTASVQSRRLRPDRQLRLPDHEWSEEGERSLDRYRSRYWRRDLLCGHAGPRDGQSIASTIAETVSGPSESASALDNPSSGQKTATGSNETAHGKKAIMTSHGERAFVHATANSPWSESAILKTMHERLETESGHRDDLHGKLDPEGEISVKSASRSGHRWSLLPLQSMTNDHPWRTGRRHRIGVSEHKGLLRAQ